MFFAWELDTQDDTKKLYLNGCAFVNKNFQQKVNKTE